NLDMIISVGYRVHSHRGVQFRMWATAVLKEYLKKGFVLNDELLKRADEVDTLNRIVNLYLEFAELQAKAHIPMYMKDWVQKLDDFLRLSNRELLTHAGKISAEIAKQKADAEYDKFRERTKYELSPVEIHFIDQFEAEQKRLKDNGKK
ncbi:MAG: virulence RhuM family protein, partial [Prevotella sp.]|nr:virulence RhuM family protein [Prevotella sp.]